MASPTFDRSSPHPIPQSKAVPTVIVGLAIAAIILGSWLRVVHLGLKPYWFDEVSTGLQLAGFSDRAIVAQLTNGQAHRLGDVLTQFQYPNAQQSWGDTIQGLAQKEPQLTPVYFLFARWWTGLWSPLVGNSIALVRSSSALLSFGVLPLAYGFCRELFGSRWVAWVAVALSSLSPFQVLQAQEARPYSLWIVWILGSSWLLLWLVRRTCSGGQGLNLWGWGLYAVVGMLALYSQLLMGPVLLAHAIYALGYGLRRRRIWRLWPYGLSGLSILASLMPWVLGPLRQSSSDTSERWGQVIPLMTLVRGWIHNFSLFFVDLNINKSSSLWIPLLGIVALLVLLCGYALYDLGRRTPIEVWGFIALMVVIPAAVIILPDLILGSDQSTFRYITPSYLMLQLVIAHLIGSGLERTWGDRHPRQAQIWGSCLGLLLLLGASSGLLYSQSPTWWNKGEGTMNHDIARLLNPLDRPTLVSNAYFVKVFSLGHLLSPNASLRLFPENKPINLPAQIPDQTYVFSPDGPTRTALAKQYRLEAMPIPLSPYLAGSPELVPSLWRIRPLGKAPPPDL
jgi:uncharacterized membrane protein